VDQQEPYDCWAGFVVVNLVGVRMVIHSLRHFLGVSVDFKELHPNAMGRMLRLFPEASKTSSRKIDIPVREVFVWMAD